MEQKKKALGKGLEELFSSEVLDFDTFESNIMETAEENDIKEIPVSEIRPNPYQPRKTFNEEALNELAESIKNYGVFQPIIVKKGLRGYDLIAGERRLRASKIAGLTKIPAIVKEFTDDEMREISLLENIQRENLNPIEKAKGLRRLLDDYGLTQQELADKLGMSRSGLTNNVRILNLDPRVIDLVVEHNFSERQCRELLKVQDPEKQYKLALGVIEYGDKYDELERKINNDKNLPKKDKEKSLKYQAIYRDIENSFQGFFGTKVKLEAGKRKGKIVIEYNSNDDLERILGLIK